MPRAPSDGFTNVGRSTTSASARSISNVSRKGNPTRPRASEQGPCRVRERRRSATNPRPSGRRVSWHPTDRGRPLHLAISTRVIAVDPREPAPLLLKEAARVLQQGGLVAFATETVYG